MTGNRSVLMVSYDFPPMGSPGALRASKFAKYLPKYGWDPNVVTCQIGDSPSTGLGEDSFDSLQVVRSRDWKRLLKKTRASKKSDASKAAPAPEPVVSRKPPTERFLSKVVRKAFFPDREISWYPSAVQAASQVAKNQNVQVVYSSALAITNHLVAGKIARRFGLPWVVEFRDLWALEWDSKKESLTQKMRKRCERAIVTQADRIVMVTENQKLAMAEAYPDSASKLVVIRNGFDPADTRDVTATAPDSRLVLTHCGMLYGGERDTLPLLSAIAQLQDQGLLTPECFQLDFVGPPEAHLAQQIESLGVSQLVHSLGKVSYQESLNRMAASSAVLIIVHTSKIGLSAVPTKFYDSLAVRRPILALVKQGYETATLVESLGAGAVIDPKNTQGNRGVDLSKGSANQKRKSATLIGPRHGSQV